MRTRRVTFELDQEDRYEAIKIIFDLPEVDRMVRRIRRMTVMTSIAFVILVSGGAALVLTLIGSSVRSPAFGVIVLLLLVFSFAFAVRNFTITGMSRELTEILANNAKMSRGPGYDGLSYVEISDDGIVVGDQYAQSRAAWPCFKRIHRRPTCTVCELPNSNFYTIPMRATGYDEDEYNALIDEIERLNEEAGGWDGIVARYLMEYSLECPDCAYQLHQNPSATCPECGRAIDTKDFQNMQSKRVAEPPDFLAPNTTHGDNHAHL